VLRSARKISDVESSLPSTMACLMFSWTGASCVIMKRVPMQMPSAPRASAAAKPCPLPKPPHATTGISSAAVAAGISTSPGVSFSPGCPPHSKPSMVTASQPIFSAFSAWRTAVHLWITLMPASLSIGRYFSGLRPAVSTIGTCASMIDRTNSS